MGVKEPFALQAAACGLYVLWLTYSERRGWPWIAVGVGLVIAGLSYFYFVTHYVQPYFSTGERGFLDSSAFSWLGTSISDIIITIFSQVHVIVLDIITTPQKVLYMVVIFGLLAFIPIVRPAALIPIIPLLALEDLSNDVRIYTWFANSRKKSDKNHSYV